MQHPRYPHIAAAGLAGTAATTRAAEPAKQDATLTHDMSAFPPEWMGKERIAMLLYPEFTALDLVGPQYMLASLWGAKVHLVAATKDPVRSDTGLTFVPSMTLDEAPAAFASLLAGADAIPEGHYADENMRSCRLWPVPRST